MATGKNIPFLLRFLKNVPFLLPLVRMFYFKRFPHLQRLLMGLEFDNPVGVAAGIDKRGEYTDIISCFSPAFIEIGPVRDVKFAISNLKKRQTGIKVFANLSNNKDLERNFSLIYDFVDGIVLNVSKNSSVSKAIDHLLELRRYNDTYKPIVFKLFSDLDLETLGEVSKYVLSSGIDGVMVGPELLEFIREKTLGLLPVIVMAEISTPERAAQMLDSGADLIALTNSPSHYGAMHITKIIKYLEKR